MGGTVKKSSGPEVRGWPGLVESLARVCEEAPIDRKILLVPNHHAGQLILQSLARLSRGWLNLRAATAAELAWEAIAVDASAKGLSAADDITLEGILIEAYQATRRAFFPDQPPLGLLAAIQRTLLEIRNAGITPEQLRASPLIKAEKARDLAAILKHYTAALRRDSLLDDADLYRLAAGKSSPQTILLLPSSLKATGLCRQFIQSYAAGRIVTLAEDPVEGVALPVACMSKTEDSVAGTALSFIFAPAKNTRPVPPIEIFAAAGARNEIREVFRRIVERRIPFEEVELAVPDYATYSALLEDVAAEVGGVRLTFGSGLPGLRSGPARTLFSFAEWLSNDLPEPILRAMFAAGGIRPPDDVTGRQAARLLRSAQIGWGRERYVDRLEARCRDIAEHLQHEEDAEKRNYLEAQKLQAEKMVAHVRDILSLLPGQGGTSCFSAAAEFLNAYAVVRSESEGAVLKNLLKRLQSSARQASPPGTLRDACLRLQAIAQSVNVAASAPAPGHIHVVPLTAGGLSGREHVFIPGLSEAAFPGTLANDPILTDEERQSLGVDLTVSSEVMRERAFQFGQALSRVRGNLYLSYSTMELSTGARIFPSPLLLQAHRLASGNYLAGYEDLAKALGVPSGFIPEKLALGDDEWWLSQIGIKGLLRDAQESVLGAFPDLKNGREGISARQDSSSNAHDGKLARDPDFDLRKSRRPVSATALEGYAACPRSFLFSHLLGIELPEDVALEPGRWLDPLERGRLLHEFYRRFLSRLKAAKQRRDPAKHVQLADVLLDEVIAEWRKLVPPPSEAVFEAERSLLHRSLGVFLREEDHVPAPGPGVPEYFELSFGLKDDAGGSSPEPVEVALPGGRSILLRGRIDRIDRLAQPGAWAVWDYKTGKAKDFKSSGYTAGGSQLQHVLYACAAEEILARLGEKNPRVVISGYLFPTERSDGNVCVPRDARRRGEGLAVVNDLLDAMALGIFLATGIGCRYCDWAAACYGDEAERWKLLTGAGDESAATMEKIYGQE
jgi:ATP-dependent helicase/nuclease subunit B